MREPTPPEATPAALLTRREVAELWGTSLRSTRKAIAAGALEPVYIPGLPRPKYRRADVEALVQNGRAGP